MVDSQVLLAGRQLSDEQKNQPEWLWFVKDTDGLDVARYSYGRWPKVQGQAPYIRADLAQFTPSTAQDRLAEIEQVLADHARSEGRKPSGSVKQQVGALIDRLHEQDKQEP